MPGVGIYAASKRGLLAAFDSLRLEISARGINVSCVMPGMFETEALTMEGLVFDGDAPPDDIPWFAPDTGPASADDPACAVTFMISQPLGLCISELVVRPTVSCTLSLRAGCSVRRAPETPPRVDRTARSPIHS